MAFAAAGEGFRPVLAGLLIGLLLFMFAGESLGGLLMDVSPRDPVVLSLSVILLALSGFMACILPVRRAARVDPVVALNAE